MAFRPEEIYWSATESDSDEGPPPAAQPYIDPWDLENYAYIRAHLDSMGSSPKGPNDDYADIDDVQYGGRRPDSAHAYDYESPADYYDKGAPMLESGQLPLEGGRPNFGLSNYGHLQIDYSLSWSHLHQYIRYHT
ncbi:uncharacterized protein LOC125503099 [Dendroctonus ponderosae]|uniref:uncharacterized protein LOC125503099 n=1 Tax=Dendroctonus ponderosae TaxID=77166 RepID=UPI0020351159|nr:uncharacterized protein LOC125503099 [Dendroctonus ponderosae]KAH1003302.1 hypothetical protein HUJ05_011230 [Dendroctonus ponderosae]